MPKLDPVEKFPLAVRKNGEYYPSQQAATSSLIIALTLRSP